MSQSYFGVLTALPHIPKLFEAKEAPVSRFQLERRLSGLSAGDRETLALIEQVMLWTRSTADPETQGLKKAAARALSRVKSEKLKRFLNWRLDLRTVVAGLRRKRQGQKAPEAPAWSFGTRYEFIRRNWSAPYFNLEFAFPFLPDLARCLEEGASFEAEKILLKAVWEELDRTRGLDNFGFDSVVIYVMRWELASQWHAYGAQEALPRFDNLVNEALGRFTDPVHVERV